MHGEEEMADAVKAPISKTVYYVSIDELSQAMP
jgi:hypothetical protein